MRYIFFMLFIGVWGQAQITDSEIIIDNGNTLSKSLSLLSMIINIAHSFQKRKPLILLLPLINIINSHNLTTRIILEKSNFLTWEADFNN